MELEIQYRVSTRAKRLRVAVHHDGRVVVTKPQKMSVKIAEQFLHNKYRWIEEKVAYFIKRKERVLRETPQVFLVGTYEEYKEQARALVHARLQHYNEMYNFTYHAVAIRNQKSRWGSCSKKGNLNFSYKLALLPPHLADYIIVHELCHLREFNHSAQFWQLVAYAIPEYKKMRKELRGIALRN